MQVFFSDEPVIRTMHNDSSGLSNYTIVRATGMQGDTILAGVTEYNGLAYTPDGHEDIDFSDMFRCMLERQELAISTLQGWNQQSPIITQDTFAFNTYLSVSDSSGAADDYSIIYDTRMITADEAGISTIHVADVSGYCANLYPDKEILWEQYFSLTYRCTTNRLESDVIMLGVNYEYTDASSGLGISAHHIIVSKLPYISFRYSGPADFQDWFESHNAKRFRFYIAHPGEDDKDFITDWLYPKWCEDPDTVYLYWVNSLGGVDFVRGKAVKSIEHETSRYENNNGIDNRRNFGTDIYAQRKFYNWSFRTSIISDKTSPDIADICSARWAWLRWPDDWQSWRSVEVTDTTATVKQGWNQSSKIFNYTFELKDSIVTKTV